MATLVLQAFPNSADEFGYSYLADTLRHGRLWNASFPPELKDVLRTIYVPDLDGKRVSQYAPGWPVVLAAFQFLGSPVAANPVLGIVAALVLLLTLREIGTPPAITSALLIMSLLAPFTLYNNASFFNHTLSGLSVLTVAWLDLRDLRKPSILNQLGIGLAFAVALATRYEVFFLMFALYVLDGLIRRRFDFVTRGVWAAVGAAPVTVLFMIYNWRITGSPFLTVVNWGTPEIGFGLYAHGADGINTPMHVVERVGRFITWWAEFASGALLLFYAVALWRRIRTATVRWFDLMLPALVAFFMLYPDGGGFQYGPRYWYAGWVLLPLTIASAFRNAEAWSVAGWRFLPSRIAVLQCIAYFGFTLGYGAFAHIQVRVRQEPLKLAATAPVPSIVLLPTLDVRYVPWQQRSIPFNSVDYTRNGPDGLGAIALANDLGDARTALLCQQVRDRTVLRMRLQGAPPRPTLEPACQQRPTSQPQPLREGEALTK